MKRISTYLKKDLTEVLQSKKGYLFNRQYLYDVKLKFTHAIQFFDIYVLITEDNKIEIYPEIWFDIDSVFFYHFRYRKDIAEKYNINKWSSFDTAIQKLLNEGFKLKYRGTSEEFENYRGNIHFEYAILEKPTSLIRDEFFNNGFCFRGDCILVNYFGHKTEIYEGDFYEKMQMISQVYPYFEKFFELSWKEITKRIKRMIKRRLQ